jgi:hypothetical protein
MHPTAQFRPWQFEPTAIDPRLETLRRTVEAARESRVLPQRVMQTIRFAREWNLPVEQTLREHYSPPELQSVFGPPSPPPPAAAQH